MILLNAFQKWRYRTFLLWTLRWTFGQDAYMSECTILFFSSFSRPFKGIALLWYILRISLNISMFSFFFIDVEFNVTYPRDWFDSNNWCETDSETGDCKTIARLDSEKVPCMNDDVVYPSGNSFYVNLETGIDIKVNTFKITGKVCFGIYSV